MNKWKAFTPLAIAIVLGLLAARVATSVVTATPAAIVAEQTNLTPIVVAAHDMDAGTTLSAADISTTKVESANLPSGAFTSVGPVVTKVTKVPVVKGEPILPTSLADDGSGYGVAATLPKGMRAITVDINDTTGVAGFLLPQSKVDVVTTLSIDGKATAKTLMGGVTVLAVGTRTNPNAPTDGSNPTQAPPQAAHTVTLLVNPKDAEKLELAATTSRIRLVLRNGRDIAVESSNGVTLADLRGNGSNNAGNDPFAATTTAAADTTPTTQPSTKSWTIQIINGGAVSSQSFEVPNVPVKPADAPSEASVSTEHEFTDR